MAVYKDCNRGTWYVSCYYTDWTGSKKGTIREDFEPKKKQSNMNQSFSQKNQHR